MIPALTHDNNRDAMPDGTAAERLPAGEPDLSALRIAFVSGNYNCLRDGANRAQNILVRYLLDHGATVRIYSPTIDNPAFPPVGELVSVPSKPLPFGRKEYRIAWRLPRAIRRDIAEFAPNLFHISLPFLHGASALKLARRMGVPVVAAMHTRFETYPRYYGFGIFERPLLAALRRFYQRSDYVVAPSESAARTMEQQGLAARVGIWTRGVDTQLFTPERRDDAWREAHGLGGAVPVIAFLGRLVVEKGLADFAATITRLRAEGLPLRVLVIGDGPARDEFKGALGDAVFVGFQHGEALARALANADVLLNPSSTEAFGNVSLEAMACGLPVVAADATGNRNLVVDGLTGVLVTPGDIEGYVSAVKPYLESPALREAHAFNALARSKAFSWERASEEMARTYLAALART